MSRLLRALLFAFGLALPLAVAALAPPAVVLAGTYSEASDPAGYLVSEKLDGVRAIWDGRQLRFRSGKTIAAPDWFVAGLPGQALDGELWLGRGQFERLSGIVRREIPDDADWRSVRYMIFELPEAQGSFTERAAAIGQLVAAAGVPWLQQIEQVPAVDRASLQRRLAEVVAGGGEGLVLHRANAAYATGRGEVLLKMKPWQDDEAVVVGQRPGRGRHAGRLGALRVRTADGREFYLGSGLSDQLRRQPPALGSTVTFRYRGLTARGLPRFASFWRLREE